MNKSVYSVGQVNSYIKNMFAQDFALKSISIRGEVSNCKYHSSGHIYFTLKDGTGVMKCVMFAGNRKGLSFVMREGQGVVASGSVAVYERDGSYQLYAREILLDGVGQLYAEYERLKKELYAQGLFSEQYKRKIPRFCFQIGVVTASTGAAIRDIVNIASRRNPYVQLFLYPAKVQGEGAAESIVRGLEVLDSMGLDCIIAGRGGGSIEDLWAFNEESVAWAIFNCETPVISAVGHEVDYTIADYVADMRAPTPSAAAELSVFDLRQFEQDMKEQELKLSRLMETHISESLMRSRQYGLRLGLFDPMRQIENRRQRAADIEERLTFYMEDRLKNCRSRLEIFCTKLDGQSPLKKLSGGYAYVEKEGGIPVLSVNGVKTGESLHIVVRDGVIEAGVQSVSKEELWKKQ